MAKYEIIYDRDGCIGAAACAAVSKNWHIADDGKADYIKKDFDDNELDNEINAAKACPVNVIRIKNKETGEMIV